jgi:uncharacterized protein YciI
MASARGVTPGSPARSSEKRRGSWSWARTGSDHFRSSVSRVAALLTRAARGASARPSLRDIDTAIAHLRKHDVQVEDWHEVSGMVRLSTFYDPDGTSWMLAQTLDGPKTDRLVELESFALVLLHRAPRAGDFSPAERERLQTAHLAHVDAMARPGKLVAAGPFSDQQDESLRGLCFYRCGLDETRDLAEGDPSVQAGRIAVDVMTWWTPKGSVSLDRGDRPLAHQ